MKRLLIICLLLSSIICFAFGKKGDPAEKDYRKETARFQLVNIPISAESMESSITHILTSELKDQILSDLTLVHFIESPGAYHYTFDQVHDGIPIYQSQVKVNTDKSPSIRSILRNDFNTQDWKKYDYTMVGFDYHQMPEFQKFVYDNFQDKAFKTEDKFSWAYDFDNNKPVEAIQIKIYAIQSHEQFELLVSRDAIIFWRDLNVSVTGSGEVFNPDPLTSAHLSYGIPLIDNNDANSLALQGELQTVTLEVTQVDTNFFLENNFVKIFDSSPPNIAPPIGSSATFSYTRDQDEFEAVNALYHITEYQKYIQNCGFLNLVNYQIDVDVHALSGADQSVFQPGSDPSLLFGDGGVDDAEDADVVVHEYGHAISYSAAPNTNVGSERTAIDEGFGDFVAASYSYSIDTFDWFKVFSWDGHNEYWQGRLANTSKRYPDNLVPSIHLSGEIWSSSLMDIFRNLGDTATKIVFQSMFSYAQNMDMPTAAALLLQADTILFNGDHFCDIYPELLNRGLVDSLAFDPCIVIVPPDTNSIRIYNTASFARSKGPVRIFFPANLGFKTIEMYDALGRLVYKKITSDQLVAIRPDDFMNAAYLLVLRVGDTEIVEPLVKFK